MWMLHDQREVAIEYKHIFIQSSYVVQNLKRNEWTETFDNEKKAI